jgi:hypothetical protein
MWPRLVSHAHLEAEHPACHLAQATKGRKYLAPSRTWLSRSLRLGVHRKNRKPIVQASECEVGSVNWSWEG